MNKIDNRLTALEKKRSTQKARNGRNGEEFLNKIADLYLKLRETGETPRSMIDRGRDMSRVERYALAVFSPYDPSLTPEGRLTEQECTEAREALQKGMTEFCIAREKFQAAADSRRVW